MISLETVMERKGQQYLGDYTPAEVELLRHKIIEFANHKQHEMPMNFLVLGEPGKGKSAFINTVASAFWNEIFTPADVGAAVDKTKTRHYGWYKNIVKQGPQPIHFYDTKGLGNDDHTDLIMACVNGKISPYSELCMKNVTGSDHSRKIHAIIFVNSVGNFDAPTIQVNLGNSIVKVSQFANIPIGVVIAHADALNDTTDSERLAARIKQQHLNFFNTDLCTFVHNYTYESELSSSTSGRVLEFIRALQHRSLQPFQRYEREQQAKSGCLVL